MAVTEITKILFRRGRESDRVELEALGGLAQGEPGFTSSGRGQLEAAEPDRYNVVGSSENIRAAFLDNRDVIDHVNRTEGGGDFFVGGAGGKDVFIGGSSAEKHWQRYFVSLYGTANNTTWETSDDSDSGLNPGYINGSFHVGKSGVSRANTKNHLTDTGDQWDVRFYGPDIGTEAASRTVPDGSTTRTIPAWTSQNQLHWDASTGKLSVYGGGALTVPAGPLAARPFGTGSSNTDEVGNANYGNAISGDIRYNSEWQTFEGYFDNSIGWGSLGGAISKDRQTYLIVDTMGGQDGCTTASPGQWQPDAMGLTTDNAMNLVINCTPTIHSTSTLWRFLTGVQVSLVDDTQSTSTGTGSLRTAGGIGVAKNIHVGGSTTIGGVLDLNSTVDDPAYTGGTATPAIDCEGGANIAKHLVVGQGAQIAGHIRSNSTTFDLLSASNVNITSNKSDGVVGLGTAVGSGSTATGYVIVRSNMDAQNSGDGALRVTGGVGIGKNLYVGSDIVAFASDERLKENIKPIDNALDKLSKLNGYTYNFNEKGQELLSESGDTQHVGVLAQEVEQVMPQVVVPAPSDQNYKTVKYDKLVPLLIESIKELNSQVQQLKDQLNNK